MPKIFRQYALANNIRNLIDLLEYEINDGIKWFKDDTMIVNLGKLQTIILDKKKHYHNKKRQKLTIKLNRSNRQ